MAELGARHVRLARDAGALTVLPIALRLPHRRSPCCRGELTKAAALIEEAQVVTGATGTQLAPY